MSTKNLSNICNHSLIESKAVDLLSLDVKNISSFADEIILATATSNRHAVSVSEQLVDHLKENKFHILGVEGEIDSGWILVDCGEVVINIMRPQHEEDQFVKRYALHFFANSLKRPSDFSILIF